MFAFVAMFFGLAAHADAGPGWRLVAAYDLASATIGQPPSSYVWRPAKGMESSCGPAKAPMGMGKFEAEAMAQGLTPTLAVMLERTDPKAPPLGPENARLAVGPEGAQVLLQPAVMPRDLVVRIQGAGSAPDLLRGMQLVRTQLEMELCLEHKTGRGWMGQDTPRLRQAFLLDPPDGLRADRMYFGGQRDPVPALLGPPDACLERQASLLEAPAQEGSQGQGTLALVPSDVWGAGLRWCGLGEAASLPLADPPPAARLRLTGEGAAGAAPTPPSWRLLDVMVGATSDSGVHLNVACDGQPLLKDAPLFAGAPADSGRGLTDILARVPERYPTAGPPEQPDRYTVLLVPNWQVVEALRRLDAGDPVRPLATSGGAARDGVGWLLAHTDLLSVQLPKGAATSDGASWLDLAELIRPGPWHSGDWGLTTGLLAGRSPVAVLRDADPGWAPALAAQRALPHALFLASLGLLVPFLLAGLRRLPELWLPMPEERADFWPGLPQKTEELPEAPETAVVEEKS